jgi:hypothetical protein
MRKNVLRAFGLAAALWLVAPAAGWALTAYVIDFSADGAFAIDPSTIQDTGPGHRTADVYEVFDSYDMQIAKMEFDCNARMAQTLTEKTYNATETGLDFKSDLGAMPPDTAKPGTILDAIVTFVCGWPQVSSNAVKIEPDVADLPHLAIFLSNEVMDEMSGPEPEQNQEPQPAEENK